MKKTLCIVGTQVEIDRSKESFLNHSEISEKFDVMFVVSNEGTRNPIDLLREVKTEVLDYPPPSPKRQRTPHHRKHK